MDVDAINDDYLVRARRFLYKLGLNASDEAIHYGRRAAIEACGTTGHPDIAFELARKAARFAFISKPQLKGK